MPSDLPRLLNRSVADNSHTIGREDVAFHRWSAGCGHEPMEEMQLRFVDPGITPQCLSMKVE